MEFKLEYVLGLAVVLLAVALAFNPIESPTGAPILEADSSFADELEQEFQEEKTVLVVPEVQEERQKPELAKLELMIPDEVETDDFEQESEIAVQDRDLQKQRMEEKIQEDDRVYRIEELKRKDGRAFGVIREYSTTNLRAANLEFDVNDNPNLERFDMVQVQEWSVDYRTRVATKISEVQ